ncbi:MAG: efflux RND transporter periplasmic adaptor subunit [Cyanobacteria bacterium REEB67]|nr:efflux RND transporter periplasmic adaptor subunit [Cyanobacteria bacterium REEB67]
MENDANKRDENDLTGQQPSAFPENAAEIERTRHINRIVEEEKREAHPVRFKYDRSAFTLGNILFLVGFLGVAGGLFYFLLLNHRQQTAPLEAPAAVRPTLDVVPVVSKTLFRVDQLPGEIDAYQDVLIYPKVRGFIKWIGVDRGAVVKEGQPMVRMYAPEYLADRNEALARVAATKAAVAVEESQLEDLKAALKKSKANLLADQSTYQRVYTASLVPGVIADNDVVQWAQSVEADQQDVNTLIKRVNAKGHELSMRKEELDAKIRGFESFADFASYLEIKAPFDGYVTERRMHVGSYVGPDGSGAYPPICRVKQLDLLRIVAPVPENDTAGVIVGSQVPFTVSSFPGRQFIGTVARISNSLDKGTRTMPVELNYLNPKYEILPGMFCKVLWPSRRRESSLFVPTSAVVSTPLNTFVCRIKNDTVEWVTVSKGQMMDKLVEVFGNLKEGDMVARAASEELVNQSKVNAVVSQARP